MRLERALIRIITVVSDAFTLAPVVSSGTTTYAGAASARSKSTGRSAVAGVTYGFVVISIGVVAGVMSPPRLGEILQA
jgi:hypothetical protein